MDKVGVAAVATIAAGGLIAVQPPVVARVADTVGALPAAAINFVVGSIVLVILVVAVGDAGSVGSIGDVAWYYLLAGGLVGAVYVGTVVVTVNTLGAAGVVGATIAGQLTASVVLDRAGVLGLQETPVTLERILGVALLLVGTYLIVR
jgi:transporter family-2 protein